MKLSMWTICAWLADHGYAPQAEITEGAACVTRVRLCLSGEESLHDDPEEAVVFPGNFLHLDNTALIVNGPDRILLEGAEPSLISNVVGEALDFYNQWELRMMQYLLDERPLQDLLDLAHEVFRRPMFIKSNSNMAFAITRGYDPSIHPDWQRLEESVFDKNSDLDPVKTLAMDAEFKKAFQQHAPSIRYSPLYKNNVLHANVWLDFQRTCEIVVLEHDRPFNNGDICLMEDFVSVVARYMSKNKFLYAVTDGVPSLFSTLLSGQVTDPAIVDMMYLSLSWSRTDNLIITVINAINMDDTPVIHVMQEKLMHALDNSYILEYEKHLVCISNLDREGGEDVLASKLAELIPQDSFAWGMSYTFEGLDKISSYYKQSLFISDMAVFAPDRHVRMSESATDVIRHYFQNQDLNPVMIHPDIRRLQQIDASENTNYFQTLFAFLLYGGNYTDTANYLGLHRNSIIYRISHIEEIININLNDINKRKQLLLSLLLCEG